MRPLQHHATRLDFSRGEAPILTIRRHLGQWRRLYIPYAVFVLSLGDRAYDPCHAKQERSFRGCERERRT
jgi:hypothetical protein